MTDMSAFARVDTALLCRRPVFRCSDLSRSREYLRTAINDHDLRCGPGDVDTALYMADTGRVQLMVLRYGPEVEVSPTPFNGFSLVQVPLRGSTEIECDGQRAVLSPGQSAMVTPRHKLKLVWSRDCEQLIIRVPHGLIGTALRSREGWRPWSARPDVLAPLTIIRDAAAARWNAVAQSMVDIAAPADGDPGCHRAWIEHSELGVATFLLTLQQSLQEAPALALPDRGRGDPMVAVEQYVRARLCAPIALEDLARAAGVSPRTLHLYCRRRYGVGPMAWLRNLRLDVARDKLQRTHGGGQVTDVAVSCGFGHIGRFAAYYRERFGELPRDTVVSG